MLPLHTEHATWFAIHATHENISENIKEAIPLSDFFDMAFSKSSQMRFISMLLSYVKGILRKYIHKTHLINGTKIEVMFYSLSKDTLRQAVLPRLLQAH